MNVALEKVMCEVVNFAQYIQSLDPEITQHEAYQILTAVLSALPAQFKNDPQAKAQLLKKAEVRRQKAVPMKKFHRQA